MNTLIYIRHWVHDVLEGTTRSSEENTMQERSKSIAKQRNLPFSRRAHSRQAFAQSHCCGHKQPNPQNVILGSQVESSDLCISRVELRGFEVFPEKLQQAFERPSDTVSMVH